MKHAIFLALAIALGACGTGTNKDGEPLTRDEVKGDGLIVWSDEISSSGANIAVARADTFLKVDETAELFPIHRFSEATWSLNLPTFGTGVPRYDVTLSPDINSDFASFAITGGLYSEDAASGRVRNVENPAALTVWWVRTGNSASFSQSALRNLYETCVGELASQGGESEIRSRLTYLALDDVFWVNSGLALTFSRTIRGEAQPGGVACIYDAGLMTARSETIPKYAFEVGGGATFTLRNMDSYKNPAREHARKLGLANENTFLEMIHPAKSDDIISFNDRASPTIPSARLRIEDVEVQAGVEVNPEAYDIVVY
ncbi:MAG: hypothetical protein AAFR74_06090 [Pseudomonadota bacterium]